VPNHSREGETRSIKRGQNTAAQDENAIGSHDIHRNSQREFRVMFPTELAICCDVRSIAIRCPRVPKTAVRVSVRFDSDRVVGITEMDLNCRQQANARFQGTALGNVSWR
jgi:hypothetical protein